MAKPPACLQVQPRDPQRLPGQPHLPHDFPEVCPRRLNLDDKVSHGAERHVTGFLSGKDGTERQAAQITTLSCGCNQKVGLTQH
jgi:hypothetical protein